MFLIINLTISGLNLNKMAGYTLRNFFPFIKSFEMGISASIPDL